MKKVLPIICIVLLIIVFSAIWILSKNEAQKPIITNFEECVAEGNSVMQSYPRQCRNSEQLFVEEIETTGTVTPPPTACTGEAKLCPDGSAVGRTGPNCEFAQCPKGSPSLQVCEYAAPPSGCDYVEGPNYNTQTGCGLVLQCLDQTEIILQEGEREGSLLVEKIYPTHITGLNFIEYPVATGQGHPITLQIGETASNGCMVRLTLVQITEDTAVFIKEVDNNKPCPICLAKNTLIDVGQGTVLVQDLKIGESVWTVNMSGERVLGVVEKVSKTAVPSDHTMVQLVLQDGRNLLVSPGHPTIDARTVGDLTPGDTYDGSQVKTSERVSYGAGYTYDLLPSGDTGFYFANDILIDSTFH